MSEESQYAYAKKYLQNYCGEWIVLGDFERCPVSQQAKAYFENKFKSKSYIFIQVNLGEHTDHPLYKLYVEKMNNPNFHTIPLIITPKGKPIGGFNELMEYFGQ